MKRSDKVRQSLTTPEVVFSLGINEGVWHVVQEYINAQSVATKGFLGERPPEKLCSLRSILMTSVTQFELVLDF